MDPDDFEGVLKKPNRIKKQDEEGGEMLIGPKPPSGIHVEGRKTRDKRRNLEIKKALK